MLPPSSRHPQLQTQRNSETIWTMVAYLIGQFFLFLLSSQSCPLRWVPVVFSLHSCIQIHWKEHVCILSLFAIYYWPPLIFIIHIANVTVSGLEQAVDTAPASDLPATVQGNNTSPPNSSATQAGTPGPTSFPDWALHPDLEPPEGDKMAEILTGPDGRVREYLQVVIWLVLINFVLANIALSSRALSVTPETSMDEDEREETLTGGLICVSCREYIFVSPADLGRRAVLWRLAHCGHPLHLQCLFYASLPPAQASQGRRHRGGKFFLGVTSSSQILLMCDRSSHPYPPALQPRCPSHPTLWRRWHDSALALSSRGLRLCPICCALP